MHYHRLKNDADRLSMSDLLLFPNKWNEYKNKFKKKYEDEAEETMRREIFFRRYRLIEEHNKKYKKKIVPFKIMATELSDRTDQEIHSIHRSNLSAKRRLTEDEEWDMFKERMKKKFDTKSKEDIPKSFFITKIHEMKQLREDLRKAGLVNDTKEFDKFCDFKNVDKMQSIVKQKLLEHKTRLDILRKLKQESNADDSKTKND